MMQLDIPAQRRDALDRMVAEMLNAQRTVLTTHVNADGDGTGSQAAIAAWLRGLGRTVTIVNPTPFPEQFRFLFDDASMIAGLGSAAADRALREADLLVVLDTAETSRIGRVAKTIADRKVAIIDHHVASDAEIAGLKLQDVTAAATGELVFDLLLHAGLERPWPWPVTAGIYTAIVTDTGSFRFANTSSRIHLLAADLIEQGVDPELMYRHIYAAVPLHRLQLLQHALEQLVVDEHAPITSISIRSDVMQRLGAGPDDLDGLVEHARSVAGTEVAILFRETSDGSTKVSLRAAGDTDVNAIARQFGGGGHVKASGALIAEPLDVARNRVLAAVRAALR
jgi:bifunctional oligoribonuclease and PAP phosphatase NrnA